MYIFTYLQDKIVGLECGRYVLWTAQNSVAPADLEGLAVPFPYIEHCFCSTFGALPYL